MPSSWKRSGNGSTLGRAFEIFFRLAGGLGWLVGWRLGFVRRGTPALRFAELLQELGTTFVKAGQHLSLRTDLFPPDYLEALARLQDAVRPFPVEAAVAQIEAAFGQPPSALFARFDAEPLAAASVAQVHSARTLDGREVVVKVLRPGVELQVERDMRMLALVVRVLTAFSSTLERYRATEVVQELRSSLAREVDLREEARNAARFALVAREWEHVTVPGVIDGLFSRTVMVQERIFGTRLSADRPRQGRVLAQGLVDAYLHMFFVMGLFHGDPHPGNVLVTEDGRLALHDFGVVGSLDRGTRHALAAFMLAFTEQDTGWMLDAWVELGAIGPRVDRQKLRPAVASILADFSGRPIGEWSVGAAFARLVAAMRDADFEVPLHLLVLARAILLLEATVRLLDPALSPLDALAARSREVMQRAISAEEPSRRLQYEAAIAGTEWQRYVAGALRRVREDGLRLRMDHEGLPEMSERLAKGTSRVALALVTLGLYIAGSLLTFQSGPTVLGIQVLSGLFYTLAIWFTIRLVRAIGDRL